MRCPQCQAEILAESRYCHSCATPLRETTGSRTIKAATFEVRRGELFAERYEIIEELGAGGMGKVFKVFDRKVNEMVALKLIRPEIGANERAIERFKNELRFTRKIAHRNICRMYDLGESGLYHYITMEYVAGEDLKRFIRRAGPLTPGKAIAIARQAAEGLAEAHGLGVVHRDLKPQNIMIDQDGNARIMDFGIARFVDVRNMTGSGVMIGTPEYMSPEQVDAEDVDGRSDIYALGVVLYEMVTGEVPFAGPTPLSIAMKHKMEAPRNVREINAAVSPALAQIVSRCMEKDPDHRFQGAVEVISALDAASTELKTGERAVPAKVKTRSKAGTGTAASTKPTRASVPSPAAAPAPARSAALRPKLLIPAGAVLLTAAAAFIIFSLSGGKMADVPLPPGEDAAAVEAQEGGNDPNVGGRAAVQADPAAKRETAQAPVSETKPPAAVKTAAKAGTPTQPASSGPPPESTPAPAEPEAPEGSADLVNLAMARVTAARSVAEKQEGAQTGLFWKMAEARAAEGRTGNARKRWADARAQFAVSERLFRLAVQEKSDERRVRGMIEFVANARRKADRDDLGPAGRKAFEAARQAEDQGVDAYGAKDFETAVRSLVQAGVVYHRLIR